MLAVRAARDRRLMCLGLTATNPMMRTASTVGSSQVGCNARLPGSRSCRPIAIRTTRLTGHRFSPSVARFHAGTERPLGLLDMCGTDPEGHFDFTQRPPQRIRRVA